VWRRLHDERQDVTRIELVRSGGFAGLSLRAAVDTTAPDDPDAAWFAQALDGLDLRRLMGQPPGAGGPSPPEGGQPDRFQYALVIDRDGEHHEVSFGETALPEVLRPVVDRLVKRARVRPRGGGPDR
jgi:hypothetical protein